MRNILHKMRPVFTLPLFLFGAAFSLTACAQDNESSTMPDSFDQVVIIPENATAVTDEQWRDALTSQEYNILRQASTERAFTGQYLDNDADEAGMYHCVGCAQALYPARHKFHSGCGWPSFFDEIEDGAITRRSDASHGMIRTELICANCEGHLGHVFNDAPDQPTGQRHCINGTILLFVPEGRDVADVMREHRLAVYRAKGGTVDETSTQTAQANDGGEGS